MSRWDTITVVKSIRPARKGSTNASASFLLMAGPLWEHVQGFLVAAQ